MKKFHALKHLSRKLILLPCNTLKNHLTALSNINSRSHNQYKQLIVNYYGNQISITINCPFLNPQANTKVRSNELQTAKCLHCNSAGAPLQLKRVYSLGVNRIGAPWGLIWSQQLKGITHRTVVPEPLRLGTCQPGWYKETDVDSE